MENQENNNGQLQIELKEEVAQGTYANWLLYSFQFGIYSRLYPRDAWNAKGWRAIAHSFGTRTCQRLLRALEENIGKYERVFRTDSHAGRTNISTSSQYQKVKRKIKKKTCSALIIQNLLVSLQPKSV